MSTTPSSEPENLRGHLELIWSDDITRPIAVRYAWADNPTCNLNDGAGCPASPFRTDEFAAVTTKGHFGPGS